MTEDSVAPVVASNGAPQARANPLLTVVILLELLLLAGVILAPLAYDYVHANHVFPGVTALGVSLGGMTRDEARAALSQPIASREEQMLVLHYGDRQWTASAAELGLRYDLEATVDRAFALGRGQGLLADTRRRVELLVNSESVDAVVAIDRVRALDYLHRLARDIDVAMQNASVGIENLQVVSTAARTGYRLDIETSAARIVEALARGQQANVNLVVAVLPPLVSDQGIVEAKATIERLLSGPVTIGFSGRDWVLSGGVVSTRSVERSWTVERAQLAAAITLEQRKSGDQVVYSARFNADKFTSFFTTIAKELNRGIVNARFDRDARTGRLTPIAVSQEGRTVDVAENVKLLAAAAASENRSFPLAVKITKPAVTVDQADRLGIKELISQGLTSYAGSSASRAYNIQLAAAKMHGVVVPPGGVFSLLEALGPITAEAGFQEGFAIVGEYTVRDVGGGVCQVATTTFRAFYSGGFQIVERNPHRYRLRIYEIKGGGVGLDAAIYDPGRDLRFKNNTNSYLLVQTDASDPNNFTVSIYGTSPGWSVTISDPVIKPGQPHGPRLPDVEDPNRPAGTRIRVQPPEDGMIVTITRTVRQGNTVISRDTLNTTYEPAREQWIVGTKK